MENDKTTDSLQVIYEGWNGYHQSIVNAVKPRTSGQLTGGQPTILIWWENWFEIFAWDVLHGSCAWMPQAALG
jgi:hypothetical protein